MQLKSLCTVTLACWPVNSFLPLFAIHFTITLQNMPPQLMNAGGWSYTYYNPECNVEFTPPTLHFFEYTSG